MEGLERKNINLVDEIADRLKTMPIGSLIKEEDLYAITADALQRAFFQESKKTVVSEYGRSSTVVAEPIIVTMVREHYQQQMKNYIDRWIKSQDEEFKKELHANLESMLANLNAEKMLATLLTEMMGNALASFRFTVGNDVAAKLGINR